MGFSEGSCNVGDWIDAQNRSNGDLGKGDSEPPGSLKANQFVTFKGDAIYVLLYKI